MRWKRLSDEEYRAALDSVGEPERTILAARLLNVTYDDLARYFHEEKITIANMRRKATDDLMAKNIPLSRLTEWVQGLPKKEQMALVGNLWDRLPLKEPPHHV